MHCHFGKAMLLLGIAFFATSIGAQTTPDAGSLLRESERQQPRPLPPYKPAAPQASPSAGQGAGSARVTVRDFAFTGNTLLSSSDLHAVLVPWLGRELDFAELQQVSNAVAETYRQRGWFVRPQLPQQDVSSGLITIHIIESRLGEVRIDDGGKALRVERGMVRDTMTARQQPGDPLNIDYLERSSNILNDTPGVAVATILSPGKSPGESDAVVKVDDKPLIAGTAQLDNSGSRSTGDKKVSLSATLDNPSGYGDQFGLNTNHSQGSDYLKLAYTIPAGSDGLRAGLSASALRYQLVGADFEALNSKGDAQTYGLNASYPLVRSGARNLSVAAAVDRKDYTNEANALATSAKRIHSLLISLTGDLLDGLSAGGMTLGGLNLTVGDVDLSAHATNLAADRNGPDTAGRYSKMGYNLARLQRINDTTTLWVALNGQIAGKNLDSSEKLSLGGPSGVRAYPVMEGTGDEGWLVTLEGRFNLLPELQLIAFYDHGTIRRDHDGGYTGALLPASGTLKGIGLGASWSQPGQYSLKVVLAQRLGDNPLRTLTAGPAYGMDSDGSYDKTRLWLSAVAFF